jgi:hypothetical protein
MTKQTKDSLILIGATWINRIKAADEREERWTKDAEAAEAAYLAGQDEEQGHVPDWNILHSNVETIVPAIYNSTPAPDIRPRHNVKDGPAKVAADIFERGIATQIDDNALDSEIEALAQDAFMAGRGIVRVRFDAEFEDIVSVDGAGNELESLGQRVVNERLIYENVAWRDYREGPAKKWADVPWVAFRHFISQSELNEITDEQLAKLQADETNPDEEEKDVDVWEIWCKDTGKVYFVVDKNNKVLNIKEDPLELSGFFPMAAPVQPITGTGRRVPVCPYSIYKKQAEELNRVTKRINAIMGGMKVRGGVATGSDSIQDLAKAGDNELVPIADVEGLVATGGLEKAIVWWPIDKAITVLRELYVAREQIKTSIYEITGISDIIRGQGHASETATAQQIKTEWGSLRIKKMQRLIERQVRDIFVISAEIMARHFSPETLAQAAGLQLTPDLAQFIQKPLDHYRIDVESDSTVRADTSKKREEMARFLEGTAQFFQVMAPLVQQTPAAAAPIAEIYGAFTNQFNLGKTAEDSVEQMVEMAKQMAQQPQPNPEAEAQKAELGLKQAEMQMRQGEMQANSQAQQAEMQIKAQEAQGKQADAQAKAQLDAAKIQLDQAKLELDREKLALEREKLSLDAQTQAGTLQNEKLQSLAAVGGDLANVMTPVIQAMQEANAAQNAALTALVEKMTARDEMMVAAMQAPKRVIKDENGRPVGVETMVN